MTTWLEIARACPIGRGLDSYRNACALDPIHEALDPTDEGNIAANNERQKNAIFPLLLAVQSLPASRLLPSKRGKGHLSLDLSKLMLAVDSDYYDLELMKPLFDAVLNEQSNEAIWGAVYELLPPSRTLSSFPRTPWSHNTSNCANPVKDCKDVGAPKKTQSMSTSASRLCCSFLQLPPEIRCMIYRILLRSEHRIRMVPPPQDEYHIPRPNNLYPSILGTCRLIHLEAQYVLYGENTFHAHRINENNHSAALIRRANYRIGLYKREDGEDEARKLA